MTEAKKPVAKLIKEVTPTPVMAQKVESKVEAEKKTEPKSAKPEMEPIKLTTATKITISRIVLVPIIMFFYLCGSPSGLFPESTFLIRFGKLIALLLFGVAAVTDWLDGHIARKHNEVTDMGKMLDPIADKILTLVGFVLIAIDYDVIKYSSYSGDGFLPAWFAVFALFIAFGRDYVINGLRFVAAEKGISIAADKYGKAKSLLQYCAIGLFMIYAFDAVQPESIFLMIGTGDMFLKIYQFTALFALSLATVLSVFSACNYLYQYRETYLGQRDKKDWGETKEERGEKLRVEGGGE